MKSRKTGNNNEKRAVSKIGKSGMFRVMGAKGEESFRKEMIRSIRGCREVISDELKKFWIWRQGHTSQRCVSKGGRKPD